MNNDHKNLPSKQSIYVLFTIGCIMIGLPLLLVLDWSSTTCKGAAQTFCAGSKLFKESTTVLPYVMLAGGAVMAYCMKKISERIFAIDDEEDSEGPHNLR